MDENDGKSHIISCQDKDEHTLDKKFETAGSQIKSDNTSCGTLCWSLEASQDVDHERSDKPPSVNHTLDDIVPRKFIGNEREVDEGYSCSTLKSSLDSNNTSSLTIVRSEAFSERNQSLTTSDNREHNSVEILRKALQGLAASSFIDDLSCSTTKLITSSSSGANLGGSQKIPSNDARKEDHVMVDAEASISTRASSKACTQPLHKSSTFTTKEEFFLKAMEARRRKFRGDDSDDGEENENAYKTSAWDDSVSNEVVKHVFNFADE